VALWDVIVEDAAIIVTLLLLEAVLSFDNAAILAALVRKLPRDQRRKALLYGLVGAYALRIAAILLATVLIENPFLRVAGGAYLLYLGVKHFINLARHREEHHEVDLKGTWLVRLGVPAFWAVIIQIELVDLAFAVDQVIAAVGFTDKIGLIIAAAMLGILFLRLAAAFIAQIMDWLPLLEHMAYLAVAFVGAKLVLEHPAIHVHVPTPISIAVTLGLFGVPILLKVAFGIPRSRPAEHAAVEESPQE